MIAYGARSAGMAGAGLALGGSVMDLESNPAHLADAKSATGEAGLRFSQSRIQYEDAFYDPDPALSYTNRHTARLRAGLPYIGFMTPLTRNVGVGLAVYVQGGGGGEFRGLIRNTRTGETINEFLGISLPVLGTVKQPRENISAKMLNARITPGLGWRSGPWKLGLAIDGVYGRVELRNTMSDPTGSFELPGVGIRYKSSPAFALSGKAGLSYDLTNHFTVAAAYSFPVKLHLDGEMSVNAGDPEFYHKTGVSLEQIWPAIYRGGISYRNGALSLAFDIDFIKWSDAFNTMTFKLEDPFIETPLGTRTALMVLKHEWRDQAVMALGFEYKPDHIAIRAGYNYGKTPVSGAGINPLFATTTEHHLTVGLGIEFGDGALDLALEYAFPNRVNGTDASNWDLAHAVFTPGRVRTAFFQHSKTMHVWSFIAGVRHKI